MASSLLLLFSKQGGNRANALTLSPAGASGSPGATTSFSVTRRPSSGLRVTPSGSSGAAGSQTSFSVSAR